ncbi:efflux RND transporter periplasmic adaptor subunit [Geobacter sp. DSM 9736]|uniref:efflux RND transporter periplasmic adaptor subunit n=1 Tax=Geobacter sp. DSM 9736 TaxID=1277350 RepID=UPI000B4FD823|nr:efflux RND transporter periplasmic adaptor subunit [Geobacter sp. DSM 9736]SNB45398.1 membrane fusion protein, Cu(I)/Ag(I) efflux system [Geobacter sp. DSM 9736]
MLMSKKIIIPVLLIAVVAAGGGGYYLWNAKAQKAGAQGTTKAENAKELYTCPMHPFIIKDKPGSCPICGMTLVKKVEGAQADAKTMEMLGHVSMSPTQMVITNVATTAVKEIPLDKDINAVGIVQYDQRRQAKVTAWVAGRIDQLLVNAVGDYVSKSKPVALVYSPDLVAAQQEYLLALRSRDRLKDSPIASISQGGAGLVSSAKQRLLLLGVKEQQLAALEKGGQPNIRLPIYTPLSGIVIEKMALEGQYVNMGEPLFAIADLSTVWVEVEVYENEFPFVKVGQRVEVTSQSYPEKTFSGRVSYIYPFLDPKTRTVKVRVEIPNPGLKLKPDMYVNARVKTPLGRTLAVPIAAVIDTGKRQVAWVEMKPGMFEPREVKVGARTADYVQILEGLKPGEKVASSGGYLIDSEAQLKGGSGGHAGHGEKKKEDKGAQAPAGGHEGHGGAAPAEKKNDIKMDDMKM